MSELVYRRPPLSLSGKVRRHLGARLIDGLFLGSSTAAGALPISHPRFHGLEVTRDVPFRDSRNAWDLLDVYRSKKVSGPKPVVFYVHGGGFRFMSKDTHWLFGTLFARAGYVVFCMNYRLAPAHKFPAAVEDVCDAYRWVVEHAAEYGGDPSRIVIAGESAGANLATGLAIATTHQRPEPFARAVFDLNAVPRAVVPACGFLQLTDPERFGYTDGFWWDRFAECTDAYLDGARLSHEGALDLADPLVALERGDRPDRQLPPFFIPCGTRDALKKDTLRLERALISLGARAEAKLYPGGLHAFHAFVFTSAARQCWRDTFRFLRETV